MRISLRSAILLLCLVTTAQAGDVEIVMVSFTKQGETWDISTTLAHADTGWDHYADAWRVTSEDKRVLATRTLYHPHVNEQPFTRSLQGVSIPSDITVVFVEAHDKVHGWSNQRVRIDLSLPSGDRYRVVSPTP